MTLHLCRAPFRRCSSRQRTDSDDSGAGPGHERHRWCVEDALSRAPTHFLWTVLGHGNPVGFRCAERPLAALRVHRVPTPSGCAWKPLRAFHTAHRVPSHQQDLWPLDSFR